uniref:ABC transporter permease subunit n=1 Tax=Dictyoglomus thermophilum TaxID=14 RepID=A0A7C3MKD0_DICTH
MKNSLRFKIIFWIIFFIFWYLMGLRVNSPAIFPYPHKVILKTISLLSDTEFLYHLSLTIIRSLVGLFLAFFIGFILGNIKNKKFYVGIRNIIDIFQSNPLIIWITLALLWFGFGSRTVIFTTFIMLFPNLYLSVYHAIKNVPTEYIELFKIYPISKKDYITKFLIPYIKPFILPVLANSTISSFKISAMSEFFATNNGIGFLLSYAKTFLNTEYIYAISIYLFIISKLLEYIFRKMNILKEDLKS